MENNKERLARRLFALLQSFSLRGGAKQEKGTGKNKKKNAKKETGIDRNLYFNRITPSVFVQDKNCYP